MLQVKNISKTYKTGDLVQVALDDVSLNLRDNEFVAILGPSGSGKTTLLNIIGGLDRYDEGDLIINNVSTKRYKNRDWDAYRNHTIGFVFQSYNLIPHQTILSNVELALTISGISKKERRKRALDALDEVGLKEQAHKKPNQMSGGQMQRVAIARALINNPDILLADEPTGALDTKTSIQVMDLLKKVAKDRLVVMVTHNPDLANDYANRIVKLQDGHIISDSNPYEVSTDDEMIEHKRLGKAKMGFFTALSLSFNNLLTKKGRTILTAFAGSIGIIGIALILSLSQGFQNYIDKIQEDTLSSYPLTLTSDTADMTSAILSMVSDRENNKVEGDRVIERQYLTTMFSSIGSNDLKSFKKYLEENEDKYINDVSDIKYTYSVSPSIYTIDAGNNIAKLYPSSLWDTLYSSSATSLMSSFTSSTGGMIFAEMPDDMENIYEKYDVLAGRWPSSYDEMFIVLSEPNSISDLLVYSLGLRNTEELRKIITSIMSQDEVDIDNKPLEFSYDDLLKLDLRLIKQTDVYKYNEKYDIYEDMSDDDDFMKEAYENAMKLKVVGIVCAKDSDSTLALSPGVNYSSKLTEYVIDEARKTTIVKKQIENKDIDVFSGNSFDEENEDKEELDFEEMISVDEDMIKDAFKVNMDEDSFEFDMMNESEMTIIVKDSSKAVVESLDDPETLKTAGETLVGINTLVLTSKIEAYETSHIDVSSLPTLKLDLSEVDTYLNDFNGNDYKSIISNNKQTSSIVDLLNDTDFNNLALAVKSMFKTYYASIPGGDIVDEKVLYTPASDEENMFVIYGDITREQPITTKTLLGAAAGDMMALSYTTKAVPSFIVYTAAATQIGNAISAVMSPLADSLSGLGDMFGEDMFEFDEDKFAEAFKFDMDEDELSRIMETMMSGSKEKSYKSNLISLGYQDVDDPTSINFYFSNFDGKENFMNFLDAYNENADEEKEIRYTDITGLLMSSVKTIVDSVTYVLIAFVSISLVVSSIMIAVITLISVMERTKEIGILRAMGASKRNVSSIFNAETFIIGLLSGLIGVGVTLLSIPPINSLIHNLTGNYDINAVLPHEAAIALILISVILTMIAGLIPSRKAAKQDPVIALRTE